MKGMVLNLGLKSIRAIIFDEKGKAITQEFRRINTHLNKDHVEQDPNEWWEKGLECMKGVLKTEKDIDFITATASAACLLPVDKKGEPLMNTIMVSDKRAVEEAKHLQELKSFKKLEKKTGAYFSLPRILWIKNNMPEVFKKAHKFLSPNDFFIHKMTGQFLIDDLNAGKYHTHKDKYHKETLAELLIDENSLPEIIPVSHPVDASKEFLEELGLKKLKVAVTTYDAICAFFGMGVGKEGDASDMSGTVTSFRVLTKKKLKKGESRIFEQKHKDWNIVGGSNNLGGGIIEWLLQSFYQEYKHEELEELEKHFVADHGLLFIPYLLGERAPLWDNDVRGSFLGIERFHTNYDMARAVLDSTGFVLRHLIETIEEQGITVNRLFVSGGLSKINLVNQIKADVTGKKIFKLKETETTSLGAYCLARQAFEPDFELDEANEVEKVYEPDPKKHEIYSNMYGLFKRAYWDLQEFYKDRKKTIVKQESRSTTL